MISHISCSYLFIRLSKTNAINWRMLVQQSQLQFEQNLVRTTSTALTHLCISLLLLRHVCLLITGPLLAKHTPGNLNKFFLALGGSEANENAIKLARFHTKRHKLIARYKSYHGATHGSIMLTGDYRRFPNEIGSPMGGVIYEAVS